MTTAVATARSGPGLSGLIRSEMLKIRTTNAWWWFALGTLVWTAGALVVNMASAHFAFEDPGALGQEGAALATAEFQGSNVYTSGQFLGLMFVMLIGILMVTNEFHHQTVTSTLLATPRRTVVIAMKLVTAVLIGMAFAVVITVIDLIAGSIFFSAEGLGTLLGEWPVQRSILLNLLAFGVWTMFGVAIGTLITNQLAATLVAAALYLVGTTVAQILFFVLSNWLGEAVLEWQVMVPSIASQVMVSGGADLPGSPAWWVGALVLVGYTLIAGLIGVSITRRRDIS